ncbi:sulfate adenylyltransferase [Arcobacter sp. FWKO B]|uniref:sulfate adenylyltransferase n=1 Tax=Arcobacter sp. FWKO B TaxID=2593672 RepID=UPI0018A4719D|nr:sulfate adenylyltransferase [Arcobacter sp. FWKO B]QOG12210.1 sulfate adenylyltransferase [Arcobacter sp. FWKO B]
MKEKYLYIDKEAVATLAMLKEGLFAPVVSLMDEKTAREVDQTKVYKGKSFPFSFVLAPSGKRNEEILKGAKKGETIKFVCDGEVIGDIVVNEVFKICKDQRIKNIYGTNNPEHVGVKDTYKRLGSYAICGDFNLKFKDIKEHKSQIDQAIEKTGAKKVSCMMLSGKPFHRVHERIIRSGLVKCDLMILFILKPYTDDFISFETRYKTLEYFIEHYLPKSRVLLIPLENTYIFGGFNEMLLNAIVAKNYGADRIIIGQNHAGLGAFYDRDGLSSIIDTLNGVDIDIEVMSEFVYCDQCKTLVSTSSCPHGSHHHIKYHSPSILEIFELGMLPPAIFMRKEISSIILSSLFPNRTEKLKRIHQNLSPSSGLIDDFEETNFYVSLMKLHQTTSLN